MKKQIILEELLVRSLDKDSKEENKFNLTISL